MVKIVNWLRLRVVKYLKRMCMEICPSCLIALFKWEENSKKGNDVPKVNVLSVHRCK